MMQSHKNNVYSFTSDTSIPPYKFSLNWLLLQQLKLTFNKGCPSVYIAQSTQTNLLMN